MSENQYRVMCVTPSLIQIEITDIDGFASDQNNSQFKIGSYLRITDNNQVSVIAIIQSYKIKDPMQNNPTATPGAKRSFVVDCSASI
jgi:hypothetical protein